MFDETEHWSVKRPSEEDCLEAVLELTRNVKPKLQTAYREPIEQLAARRLEPTYLDAYLERPSKNSSFIRFVAEIRMKLIHRKSREEYRVTLAIPNRCIRQTIDELEERIRKSIADCFVFAFLYSDPEMQHFREHCEWRSDLGPKIMENAQALHQKIIEGRLRQD